jgi:uncharacterized protein YndB with AHSA1/START domain
MSYIYGVPGNQASLRLTRRYDASPNDVWAALSEDDSRSRWLAPPPDVEATVRTVEPGRVLELDWRRNGEPESLVRLEVAAEASGSVVVLDHSRLEARICMRYFPFWTQRIARLGRTLGAAA